MNKKLKILVADAWTRKGLSFVRALGGSGHEVYVAAQKFLSPALYSKYTFEKIILSNPEKDFEIYKEILHKVIQENSVEVFLPMEEHDIRAVYELRKQYPQNEIYQKVVLPEKGDYLKAANKNTTTELAKKLGINVPSSILIRDEKELEQFRDAIYPLIVKPINSSGSRGMKKVNNYLELLTHYKKTNKSFTEFLVQQCIIGYGAGVGLLAKDGNLLLSYEYKRLREFPVSGGPSTLRETVDFPELKATTEKLMKALNWSGLAMVEFKIDNHNQAWLLEINPRSWGSIELASVAGLNFADAYAKLSIGEKVELKKATIGKRCRWLIPGDIAHFVANPKRFSLQPSFFKFFDKNTSYDQLKWSDFKGTMVVYLFTFLQIFDLTVWKKGIFRNG